MILGAVTAGVTSTFKLNTTANFKDRSASPGQLFTEGSSDADKLGYKQPPNPCKLAEPANTSAPFETTHLAPTLPTLPDPDPDPDPDPNPDVLLFVDVSSKLEFVKIDEIILLLNRDSVNVVFDENGSTSP